MSAIVAEKQIPVQCEFTPNELSLIAIAAQKLGIGSDSFAPEEFSALAAKAWRLRPPASWSDNVPFAE